MDRPSSPWWQVFIDAIDELPPAERPRRLAGLALQLKARGERQAAAGEALRAWRLARETDASQGNEEIALALAAVTPRYHVQISTDAARIATWGAALADVLHPGMLALEVGAGSGILAMLAARTGANVVSCEKDPVLAAMAEEIVRRNRLAGPVRIVGKAVEALRIPEDLPRPADLLMLDVFADNLFGFQPFDIVRLAQKLLRPGAVTLPTQVSLEAAMVDFARWQRNMPGRVAGFDLSPLADLVTASIPIDPSDPDLSLRSTPVSMVKALLPDDMPPDKGSSERALVCDGGKVNGVAVWLRLEVAPGHVLEARPGDAPRGFYAKPVFFALREAFDTQPGQKCHVRMNWADAKIQIRLIEPPPPRALNS